MKKRIAAIAVMAVMALSVFAFAGCDLSSDLSEYKATAEAAIQSHAETKIAENGYTTQGLEAIEKAVVEGKEAVNNATTKAIVTTECNKAIQAIDDVPKKSAGAFYSLQEAYNAGLLMVEDLQNIAYYHNDDSMPVYPEALSAEVEKAIKETRANDLRSHTSANNATAEDVTVIAYYGTYDGNVAIMIEDAFTGYGQATWTETVEGIDFHYGDGNKILIWSNDVERREQIVGTFYSLQEAYEAGFITQDDIKHVAFFAAGEVLNADLVRIDFVAQMEKPVLTALGVSVVDGMKMAFYEKHKAAFDSHNANTNDVTIVAFFGEYNGSFAVQMTATFMEYGDGSYIENIADIAWTQFAPSITIFVIN